jgi:hypothetical protein
VKSEDNGLLPIPARTKRLREKLERASSLVQVIELEASIAELNHIVWPARDAKHRLVRPPSSHILDALVRSEFADSGAPDFQIHPRAGTVAIVDELPDCGPCSRSGRESVSALYDAPLGRSANEMWDFMCPDCYKGRSSGLLGVGEGQYLLARSDIPRPVQEAVDKVRAYWRSKLGSI